MSRRPTLVFSAVWRTSPSYERRALEAGCAPVVQLVVYLAVHLGVGWASEPLLEEPKNNASLEALITEHATQEDSRS